MSKRSSLSQAFHDGFDRYLLPALAPLGFVRAEVPADHRAVGWTVLMAGCTLPSGAQVRAEISATGTSPPRFMLSGPAGGIELMCTRRDPAYPKATTLSHAMSDFAALLEGRDEQVLAERYLLGLEFLAAEFVVASDQLVAAIPELARRVASARTTALWRDSPARAEVLWNNRKMRSEVEARPEQGTFAFVGSGLATVVVRGTRYTFRFDTSKIDRKATPIVSGWWTTPAGTIRPSTLTVGEVTLTFNEAGELR
ncbi:MAG: hypothetical protein H0T89_03995 [Deltaproteobacteria bacterium]|nr:hypothetical protein [Deltaproteobacteria bacterium]MDQ3300907.1 hypothetical protein [Myxococcota bacterium]